MAQVERKIWIIIKTTILVWTLTWFVLKHFGEDIKIKDITRSEYQKFISNYANGRTSETVRKVNLYLSSCIKDAVYDGYIKKIQHITLKLKEQNKLKRRCEIFND